MNKLGACLAILIAASAGAAHAADLPTTKAPRGGAARQLLRQLLDLAELERRGLPDQHLGVTLYGDARRGLRLRVQRRRLQQLVQQRRREHHHQAEHARAAVAADAERPQPVGRRRQDERADRVDRLVADRGRRNRLQPVRLQPRLCAEGAAGEQRQVAVPPERQRRFRAAPASRSTRSGSSASATRPTER